MTINLGVIGLGHIGRYHIEAVNRFEELRLIAVCDQNKKYSSITPPGVSFFQNYQLMFDDKKIETVVVATPNETHYAIALDALKNGKHLILEKPASQNMEQLKHLEAVAKAYKLSIYYSFHAADAFEVNWFTEYIQKLEVTNPLGPITGFSSRFYDPYMYKGQLLASAKGLQNCWLDSGINALSVLSRFINIENLVVENVSAAINNNGDAPSFLQCHTEFSFPVVSNKGSGFGVIDTNWTTGRNHKSTDLIFGNSTKRFRLNHSNQKVYLLNNLGHIEELANLSEGRDRLLNHYIGVFQDFIKHKNSDTTNSKMALNCHQVLFKALDMVNIPI